MLQHNNMRWIMAMVFCLFTHSLHGHEDFYTTADFDNVKVRIRTGFDYEEIPKVLMFGRLADSLAKKYRYAGPIFLDFDHSYTSDRSPVFFISFDKGMIVEPWTPENGEDVLENESIVIRQVARHFDGLTTLKLLEYAILNIDKVKANQSTIQYKDVYRSWKINTIDTTVIREVVASSVSQPIKECMSLGIERSEVRARDKEYCFGVSYIYRENNYTIITNDNVHPEREVFSVDNVYQMKCFGSSAFIFDTDSSFYHVSQGTGKAVSVRHTIRDATNNYRPFTLDYIGGQKFAIYFHYYSNEDGPQPIERTLLYFSDKDRLIQNLDALIEQAE